MGAKAFFQKPVENDELLEALESVCRTEKVESKNAKILIVDDDQDTLMAISLRLRMNGYDTALATDGISAITVAQREHPDLVLLDLGLPGGDGFVVLERLRMFASLAAVPVVILSGQDPHENRNRAMEAGLSTYLQKPVDNEEMLAAIERCLSRPAMFVPTAMPPEPSRPAS
jgi:DNA-binding response OmpR family regulator